MKPSLFVCWIASGLLCCWVLGSSTAQAERLADDRFAHLGAHEGLDGRVLDIVQDPQGFLWFATTTGLHRYDGSRLTSFGHDADNPHSISENHVSKLLVDSTGTLWVATDGGDLDQWLPGEERFRRLLDLGGTPTRVEELAPGQLLVALYGSEVVRVSSADASSCLVGLTVSSPSTQDRSWSMRPRRGSS